MITAVYASVKVEQLTSELDEDGEEKLGLRIGVRVGCRVGQPMLAGPRTKFYDLRVGERDYPGVVVCDGGEEVVVRQLGDAFALVKVEDEVDGAH